MSEKRKKPRVRKKERPKSQRPGHDGGVASTVGLSEPLLVDLQLRLAQLAVDSGCDIPRMMEHFQRACVIAAAGRSRFSNKKPNHSGIAAMTGLPRAEVKRILETASSDGSAAEYEPRGVERVIFGWLNDPEFLSPGLEPLALPRVGPQGSFDVLVSRYGNDVPSAAILRELARRRYVTSANGRITLVSLRGRPPKSSITKRLADVVTPLLETVVAMPDSASVTVGTESVTIEVPDDISYKLLQRHLNIAVPLFFEQARIAANGIFEKKRKKASSKNAKYVRLDLISLAKK